MEKEKKRSEIPTKYKWDLTKIYASDEAWSKDLANLKKLIPEITKYEKTAFKDLENLTNFTKLEEEIDKYFNKLSMYASLKSCEDNTNVTYQKMNQLLTNVWLANLKASSFVDELFYKTDYKHIQDLVASTSFLKPYRASFEDKARFKDHYLSKDKEELVNNFRKPLGASSEIFEMLDSSELKFGTIKVNGKALELTTSNYSTLIESPDRKVRKSAFTKLHKTFGNYINTITLAYNGSLDADTALTRVYNYKTTLERSLFYDNIPETLYDNLIASVHNNLDKLYAYFALKQKLLNIPSIHLYDMYTKAINMPTTKYSYEEAVDLVLKALEPLGTSYLEQAKKILTEGYVDVYHNTGKTTGAFSAGTYDTPTYILTNFEGNLNSVETLAHELGHSMHTYYTVTNNARPNGDYHIFVAEVASTVNELIFNDYLIKHSQDKTAKMAILNNLLDEYKGTIYRQTMFAEFEREMHKRNEEGIPLTNDTLCDYYYNLNKLYFGPKVQLDKEIKYEWARIPHFYNSFYVYKYATSMSAATYIADKIISGDQEFRDKYLNFLKLGSSMYPNEELKTLGIDMAKSTVVDAALTKFGELTKELQKLTDKGE